MWMFWIGISLFIFSDLEAKGNNNNTPDYIYCYDCHYDPDTEKEAYTQSGPYPGYPKCAMDANVDEGRIDKWPCRAGKCFIRRDPNGLVYRGCADPANLPWGVDDNINCEYQGQKPSLWWFCEGGLCNGGNFGSGDICPESPALPYDINDDAYVETVHGPSYAEENYPGDNEGYSGKNYEKEDTYSGKSYKEEPVYEEPKSKGKTEYVPPKIEKEPSYPEPEKSGYDSKGKEGSQSVDVYGVYTAEVAPMFPKKSVYPGPYDPWRIPYDPSYQKYGFPQKHDKSVYNEGKKSHQQVYEEPKKSGFDSKSNSGYQTKQIPEPSYKSVEPPKQPSYKPEPPKEPSYKPEPPKQPHYKSEPPKQPHYKSEPPKKSSYKSEPSKQPSYKSEPPKQPSYKSEPPKKSNYKPEPPKQTSYKSYHPKQPVYSGKKSFQPHYKSSPVKSNHGQYKSTGYGYKKSQQPAPQPPSKQKPVDPQTQSVDFVHGLYNKEQGYDNSQNTMDSYGPDNYEDSKPGYDTQVNTGYNSYESEIDTSYSQQQPYGAEAGAKFGFDSYSEYSNEYGGSEGYGYNLENYEKYGEGNNGYDSSVSNPCDGRCQNNPSGLFPHPLKNDWFIQCGNGMDSGKTCKCCKPYYLQCPRGTTFDMSSRVCGEITGSYGASGAEQKYRSIEY